MGRAGEGCENRQILPVRYGSVVTLGTLPSVALSSATAATSFPGQPLTIMRPPLFRWLPTKMSDGLSQESILEPELACFGGPQNTAAGHDLLAVLNSSTKRIGQRLCMPYYWYIIESSTWPSAA